MRSFSRVELSGGMMHACPGKPAGWAGLPAKRWSNGLYATMPAS